MLKHTLASFLLFSALLLTSCGSHDFEDIFECSSFECLLEGAKIRSLTGWLMDKEDLSNIPQDISISNFSSGSLPPTASLENRFPPIGNQGQYGTCVVWATGYYLKTALNAIERGWSSADLARAENQTSPKDMWFTLPSNRNPNCDGTSFEMALDALIAKGAASLSSVPYSNMGNCSGTSNGDPNNRLANYRKIAFNYDIAGGRGSSGMDIGNFKTYLAQGRPIVFGAKLGDRFMRWNSASVISSDTYNNPGMQHAYHAMVVVGYDDSREAFRVLNSWGSNWGDRGSIWIDYDYFLDNFTFAAFVAQNPPPQVDEQVKEEQLVSGYDLLAAFAEDFPDPEDNSPRARAFSYDVYNAGRETIRADQKWTVLYMYYNAFDANEFGIIFEDYYTNEYGSLGQHGNYQSKALAGGVWNHMNVLPGKKAGEAEFGEEGFYISYEMPRITGKYFLVVYADAYDAIKESNEDNNFYFIGAAGGQTLDIVDGVLQNEPVPFTARILAKESGNKVPRALAKSVQEIGGSANAYTPAEIKSLVEQSKKSGVLAKKIAEYREGERKLVKRPRVGK
jgi:hypothetical protein